MSGVQVNVTRLSVIVVAVAALVAFGFRVADDRGTIRARVEASEVRALQHEQWIKDQTTRLVAAEQKNGELEKTLIRIEATLNNLDRTLTEWRRDPRRP